MARCGFAEHSLMYQGATGCIRMTLIPADLVRQQAPMTELVGPSRELPCITHTAYTGHPDASLCGAHHDANGTACNAGVHAARRGWERKHLLCSIQLQGRHLRHTRLGYCWL